MFQLYRNSGTLKLLKPKGPVQACIGIDLTNNIPYNSCNYVITKLRLTSKIQRRKSGTCSANRLHLLQKLYTLGIRPSPSFIVFHIINYPLFPMPNVFVWGYSVLNTCFVHVFLENKTHMHAQNISKFSV